MIREFKGNIKKDSRVCKPNYYFDNGQGCGTIWFISRKQAEKFLEKHGMIGGRDSGLCNKCACSYSYGTEEYKKYPEYACTKWKIKKIEEL